jgi:hypothetical protein
LPASRRQPFGLFDHGDLLISHVRDERGFPIELAVQIDDQGARLLLAVENVASVGPTDAGSLDNLSDGGFGHPSVFAYDGHEFKRKSSAIG